MNLPACFPSSALTRFLAAAAISVLPPFLPPAAAGDYYPHPLYHVGLPGRPFLTQVSPEGWLNNGVVEFPYLTGTEMSPLTGIAITASPDGRPILRGRKDLDGLRYDLEYFSAPLVEGPRVPPQVDVVRVVIRNIDTRTRVARFWSGIRSADEPGRGYRPEQSFRWTWRFDMRRNVVTRDMGVVAAYPLGYVERFSWAGHVYDGRFALNPRFYKRNSAVAMARYDFLLRPGQDTSLVFLYPAEPGPASYAALLNSQDYATLRGRFDRLWDGILAGFPDLSLGEPALTAFVRGNLVLTILQTTYWEDRTLFAYGDKNVHPSPEALEFASIARVWHRLGLAAWEAQAMQGIRDLESPSLILSTRVEGRAGTAGVVGLLSELAVSSPHPGAGTPGDTLSLRADSLASWTRPGAVERASALECGAGAWALGAYADLLDACGRQAEAARRRQQSRESFEAARGKLLANGPSVVLGPDFEALPWMARTGAIPADILALLKPSTRWSLQEGLVTPSNDTAAPSASLSRVRAMPPGSPEATQALLAVAAHSTLQGGIPTGIDLRTREFHQMMPPNAWLGSRAVEEILGWVARDSGAYLMLGRGLPPPGNGDTLSVGPLSTRFGPLHIRARFGPGTTEWTWTGSSGAAKVRAYPPAGTRLRGGGAFVETDLSAGRLTLAWNGAPTGRNLSGWIRDLEPARARPARAGRGYKRR